MLRLGVSFLTFGVSFDTFWDYSVSRLRVSFLTFEGLSVLRLKVSFVTFGC